jgi:hypothetical protein
MEEREIENLIGSIDLEYNYLGARISNVSYYDGVVKLTVNNPDRASEYDFEDIALDVLGNSIRSVEAHEYDDYMVEVLIHY